MCLEYTKHIKVRILILSFMFICVLCSIASADTRRTVEISANNIAVDGESYPLSERSFADHDDIYVPADDLLPLLGYTLGWNTDMCAIEAVKGESDVIIPLNSYEIYINGTALHSESPTLIFHNLGYICLSYLRTIEPEVSFAYDESVEPYPAWRRSSGLPKSVPYSKKADKYRIEEKFAQRVGSYVILNGDYIFSPIKIDDAAISDYANIVNRFADILPEVKVYNMVIPDSYEIYAPDSYSTGQFEDIEKIYSLTDSRVASIDVCRDLIEKAVEKIYFSTDHHWTQRGAYYAYRAFLDYSNRTLPPLAQFETANSGSFRGSYAKTLMENTEFTFEWELFERYMSLYDTTAAVYTDMEMQNKIGEVPLVNRLKNDYGAFIGGDNPLTVIKSNAGTGKSLAIIKDSFGNAFSTWAVNNYDTIYVIDVRGFNYVIQEGNPFNIRDFYEMTGFDDLLIMSYPTAVAKADLRSALSSYSGS